MYRSIFKKGIGKFEEKKSVFIGYSSPAESEEEALNFIDEIKKKHSDATHNCFAYIIGENSIIQRFDDDGEPSGTAGIPMLEVLKREELTNLVVVVTRYFGGTLLGAGGLIRAYSKGSKLAVDSGVIVDKKIYVKIKSHYDYVYHGKIINFIEKNNYNIKNIEYLDKVTITNLVSNEKLENFKKDIVNITSNEVDFLGEEEVIESELKGELVSNG